MGDVLVDAVPPSAVHLCVDMQRIFSTPWMERVLPIVTRIAERFPEHPLHHAGNACRRDRAMAQLL